ncbi:hypothetical protein FB451DRAFT_1406531 [Mycena latifolia]|nr:hypothetical protein FB451DRAFT_1406531 [Mycena latifolia]
MAKAIIEEILRWRTNQEQHAWHANARQHCHCTTPRHAAPRRKTGAPVERFKLVLRNAPLEGLDAIARANGEEVGGSAFLARTSTSVRSRTKPTAKTRVSSRSSDGILLVYAEVTRPWVISLVTSACPPADRSMPMSIRVSLLARALPAATSSSSSLLAGLALRARAPAPLARLPRVFVHLRDARALGKRAPLAFSAPSLLRVADLLPVDETLLDERGSRRRFSLMRGSSAVVSARRKERWEELTVTHDVPADEDERKDHVEDADGPELVIAAPPASCASPEVLRPRRQRASQKRLSFPNAPKSPVWCASVDVEPTSPLRTRSSRRTPDMHDTYTRGAQYRSRSRSPITSRPRMCLVPCGYGGRG